MEYEDVLKIIKSAAAEVFALPEDDISPDTEFVSDLGCESLDVTELLFIAEEEFGVPEIRAEEVKDIETIGDACDFICGKLGS